MDIFEGIKQDHHEARELMEQIAKTTNRSEKKRRELFDQFRLQIWAHEKLEEATFYQMLKQKGLAKEILEALNEHQVAGNVLEELNTAAIATDEWLQKFCMLQELIQHHMQEEEDEYFELGRKKLTDKEASKLGEEFAQRKQAVLHAITPI